MMAAGATNIHAVSDVEVNLLGLVASVLHVSVDVLHASCHFTTFYTVDTARLFITKGICGLTIGSTIQYACRQRWCLD